MADEYQFTNNAESTLAAALGGGDISFAVAAGKGALFPAVAAADGQSFRILVKEGATEEWMTCLLYTSPSPRDRTRSRMPSSA